ncbi:MAG: UDP-N-acetylmuramoyl-L-alanyl-D-glutamate--2,6-diaminopimelate ligase, partial [Alistipes sp.]|nr:UDP-N-acetylmuramoyl-L-alanyl-D-glutamate--2,6-diaminopimelate ligase [Alistipes sp.]
MKRLSQLLGSVRASYISAAVDPEISALVYDSRKVGRGDCFFAVMGTASDGHDFISSAVERGAAAVVCQTLPAECSADLCYVVTDDSNIAMAHMAAAGYDSPTRSLELVGITGT